jgi:methionyl-tRNA formyltransferase
MKQLRIVFFGTPDFAVASLEKLVTSGMQVVAVVTAPDKPAGRGLQIMESPVKRFALGHKLPLLQPTNLKNPDFIAQLRSYNADIQVVIAFRMLPEIVWNMPPLGTINLHASLLPQYRGAAPINWAIINGEKITGVSTFKLKHEVDTGDILLQKEIQIEEDDDAGKLHDKLMMEGAKLMLATIENIQNGTYNVIPQLINEHIRLAPKIHTEDCFIDWNQSGKDILNRIRGLSPYPGAMTRINSKLFKLYKSEFIPLPISEDKPGKVLIRSNKMYVVCKDGLINILYLQMEGKKRMETAEFLRGHQQFIP